MLLVFALAGCANGTETIQEERESAEVSVESIEENVTSEYSVEEVGFERDGLHIYGELFLPKSDAPLPLVVISHGFGGNARQVRAYAEMFAENGITACAFDFIGGGSGSRSDGKITEMSVLTEAADLNAVIDGLTARDDIDASELLIAGKRYTLHPRNWHIADI